MKESSSGSHTGSRYQDVWARETEICPYCAQELAYEDEKCPRCRHGLVTWHFRYEQPSTNIHILWVLLAGLGQLYLINGALDIVLDIGLGYLLIHALLTLLFFGLALAVYYRQSWAHISATVILLILLFLRTLNILGLTDRFLPAAGDPLEILFVSPVLNFVLSAVDALQLAGLFLALLWAVLLTGPDFERKKKRLRARLDSHLREASGFYVTGRRYARQGRWATAVLHWQRAVAQAPANRHYHRRLGQGYARLDFLERSAEALQTARDLTVEPEEQQQIEQLLTRVQRQLKAAGQDE